MTPFVLTGPDAADLGPGMHLLEASAGTGKTWTITGIIARLVIEEGVPLERIAVMTFTRAATAELRERIRRRLGRLARLFTTGLTDPDPVETWLSERWAVQADPAPWRRRARIAAAAVDGAQITTIHGFAQRLAILHGAGGVSPAATVEPDLGGWRRTWIADELRRWRVSLPLGVWSLTRIDARRLETLAKACEAHPDARLVGGEAGDRDLGTEADAIATLCDADTLLPVVGPGGRFRGNTTLGKAGTALLVQALADCWHTPTAVDGKRLAALPGLLTDEALAAAVPKGADPVAVASLPGITALRRIAGWAAGLTVRLERAFLDRYRAALAARPGQGETLGHGDALTALDGALAEDPGTLAAAAGADLDAVLVDEFQDTDQQQWRILARLFASGRHRLILIGDPKQAIYRFRGADIQAYLAARAAVPAGRRASLGINHRTDADLVAAVADLYATPDPFADPAIAFAPVGARHPGPRLRLAADGDPRPLIVWHAEARTLGEADRQAAAGTALEIQRLLAGGGSLALAGDEPLRPRHHAVLVRAHEQGALVAEALDALGIPSVRNDRSPVFSGAAARDLTTLLAAMLDPLDERLVRAAAAGPAFGLAAADLLRDGPGAPLDGLRRLCAELGRRWRSEGIATAWWAFLDHAPDGTSRRARIAGLRGGERWLADALHLAERLAETERERRLAPEVLLAWLAGGGDGDQDADLRRLERDDDAVAIVTVFQAKGLQYPIVFEPFAWRAPSADKVVVCHASGGALWHLDPTPEQIATAAADALADRARQLYVGLTRAEVRLYVLAMTIAGAPTGGPVDRLAQPEDDSHPRIRRLPLPVASGEPALLAVAPVPLPAERPLIAGTAIHRRRWTSSYSGLVERLERERDHDHRSTTGADDGLPAGAAFGTALHGCIEHAVLDRVRTLGSTALITGATDQLAGAGIDVVHAPAVARFAAACLTTVPPGLDRPLADADALVREVPFTLPVRDASGLAAALEGLPGHPDYHRRLTAVAPPPGVFNGVIDAVAAMSGRFHIVDWKSNRLPGYGPADLDRAMAEHDYLLQVHVYAVALHRWLRRRQAGYDPALHLGMGLYAFARGLPQAGWWAMALDPDRVHRLDACFAGGGR